MTTTTKEPIMTIKTKMQINAYLFVIIAILLLVNEVEMRLIDDLRMLLNIQIP